MKYFYLILNYLFQIFTSILFKKLKVKNPQKWNTFCSRLLKMFCLTQNIFSLFCFGEKLTSFHFESILNYFSSSIFLVWTSNKKSVIHTALVMSSKHAYFYPIHFIKKWLKSLKYSNLNCCTFASLTWNYRNAGIN